MCTLFKKQLIFLLFTFFSFLIYAQDNFPGFVNWTHFTTNNGLPSNEIRHLIEDADGYLLVVTINKGIYRYDGLQFSPLEINDELPSLFIQCVVKDKKGRLWIACNYSGLWIYDHGDLYPFQFNELFQKQHFVTMYCDDKNNIWINVDKIGLFVYDGETCENLTSKYSLPKNNIIQICQKDDTSMYLLYVNSGLFQLNLKPNVQLETVFEPDDIIRSFVVRKNGDIWLIMRSRGIMQLSEDSQSLILNTHDFESFGETCFLFRDNYERIWFTKQDKIYCHHDDKLDSVIVDNIGLSTPFEDRFDNLWFAAGHGIYKFVQCDLKSWDIPYNASGNNSYQISTNFLYHDQNGNLWFTDQDNRLYQFENNKVEEFNLPDSLSKIKITKIIQDENDIYYFATYGQGVFSWDGINFKLLVASDKLPGKYITSLHKDSKENLWIGAISSLSHFSAPKKILNERPSYSAQYNFSDSLSITSMFVDSNETVWFGTFVSSLFKSSGESFEKVKPLKSNGVDLLYVQNLCHINNKIWGTNNRGLFNFDFKSKELASYRTPIYDSEMLNNVITGSPELLTGDFAYNLSWNELEKFKHFKIRENVPIYNISSLIEEEDGIWLGSYSVGLFFVNQDTVIHFNSTMGLPSLKISCLHKDRKNSIWVGTLDKGLFQIKNNLVNQPDKYNIIGKSISAIYEDKNRKLWIGTVDNGLFKIPNDKIINYSDPKYHFSIMGIGESPTGNVYLCLENCQFAQLVGNRFKIYPIETILSNQDLRLAFKERCINFREYFLEHDKKISSGLVCWDGEKIKRYTVEDGLPGHEITDIVETNDGKLWVSTFNNGIAVFDQNKFYPINSPELNGLSRYITLCASQDSALWVLTNGEGIARIKQDSIRVWGSGSSLITLPTHDMKINQDNQPILLSQQNGFYFFNAGNTQKIPGLNSIKNFPPINEFFELDKNNRIWFITSDRKLHSYQQKSIPPIINIKSCQVGNDIYSGANLKKSLIRKYNDKTCVIECFGYHSSYPSQNLKYSYRIIKNKKSDNWSQPTTQNRIIYNQLEPGKSHIFQIRAQTPNGIYSTGLASVNIQLEKTPIYLKPWFFWVLLLFIAIFIALYFIYRFYRVRKIITRRRFNPYIAGEPIFSKNLFYGREKILNQILSILHNNSIMVVGERRIGKTSLLIQVKQELKKTSDPDYEFLPVHVDLQGINQWDFFKTIIQDIIEELQVSAADLVLFLHRKQQEYNYRNFNSDFRKIIKFLSANNHKSIKLVLLIDEADAMNEYEQTVHAQLRRVFMQEFSQHFAAIIAGTNYIKNWSRPESPWWNLFTLIELNPIEKNDAIKLIQEPVKGIFKFKDEALEKIITYTNCKPFLIQQLCIKIINNLLDERRRTVFVEDVVLLVEQND